MAAAQAPVVFGERGIEKGQLYHPIGVAVSGEGEIFVANYRIPKIQVFDLQGTSIRQFPTAVPAGEEQEMWPHDVAIDGEGNLWVVGYAPHAEVQQTYAVKYTREGMVRGHISLQSSGVERGVAVDTGNNHILVTQWIGGTVRPESIGGKMEFTKPQGIVQVYMPDGAHVKNIGWQQGMEKPKYVTVDGEGKILVSDQANHCIHVYTQDGQSLGKFGGGGILNGQLSDPHGICTDRAGNIIVADYWNSRVELFDNQGRFRKHIYKGNYMSRPLAVAIAPRGQLVVTTDEPKVAIFHTY